MVALHLLEPATLRQAVESESKFGKPCLRLIAGILSSESETAGMRDERTGQAESADVVDEEGEKVGAPDTN
jgi:hypothetical protein